MDEDVASLGTALKLPSWLESQRDEIEQTRAETEQVYQEAVQERQRFVDLRKRWKKRWASGRREAAAPRAPDAARSSSTR